jgi:hypothetical protein
MEQTTNDVPDPPVVPESSGKSTANSDIRCLICCDKKDKFPDRPFIQACQRCKTYLCRHCIWKMYQRGIKSQTNMPPRCCVFIPLHFALPFISADEAEAFRAAFEEFSTLGTDRIYCPQRTCSAFIPQRLIAARNTTDSLSKLETVACRKCNTEACTKCKGFAHPGPCPPTQNDILLETRLLKWGYKVRELPVQIRSS